MTDRCARCLPCAYVCQEGQRLWHRYEDATTDAEREDAWREWVRHLDGEENE